ncbi:MAG: recombination protein [Pseudomonadota bacterium]|jgi:DNA recombination protein RmuC
MDSIVIVIIAIAALMGGIAAGLILGRSRAAAQQSAALSQVQAELGARLAVAHSEQEQAQAQLRTRLDELHQALADQARMRDTLDAARDEVAALSERSRRLPELEAGLRELRTALEAAQADASRLGIEAEGLRQQLKAERDASAEKLSLLERARESLSDQFKALAGEILESNSRRFAEQNQNNLSQILEPLRERLGSFQQKVESIYVEEGKDRSALKEQVQQLMRLNNTLSEEARQLTAALRGSSKQQGNWGELVLERVLEASGLRKNHEYLVQDARTDADGQRRQPDVVILLPEDRRLVVDAKVSLIAYERLVNADDDAQREVALREHLNSVRNHLRQLSDKAYQNLYGGESLDFVLMFVPIEPAFISAVNADARLFMDAWENNVLLVSPSTLLFVVRTVAHLWRQEAQNRNAQDIARRGAELYDRLVGFTEELLQVGSKLEAAQDAWRNATKRLSEGRGNVIRQAEMLRELGVKPTKSMPRALSASAQDESSAQAPEA